MEGSRGWWRREFAVNGECGFERDEGGSMLDEVGEGVVQIAGLLLKDAEGDLDACVTEFG